jgi:16S rRNA (adenine1518-N6/adenine1519-N6)-dimethyltransferase
MPGISEDGLSPLREVIAAYGLSARKGLGQNFILDFNLTRRIAREASPFSNGAVYEVGPGPGGLTRALLLEGAERVLAVERDVRCIPALEQIQRALPDKLELVNANALEANEVELLTSHGIETPVPAVANLPFNVGTALLVKWLTVADWPPWWSKLTLMFQAEVAARICAKPGEDSYGRLSVLSQWRSTPKLMFEVSHRAFVPPPKVDAAVVNITPLPKPKFPAELEDLEAVTAAAFGQRRKMLRRSLKTLSPDVDEMLKHSGIDGRARAEELDIEQFCSLARAVRAVRAA